MFHIVKDTMVYEGHGYSELVCDVAGVERGKLYPSREAAEQDARKLQAVNRVGYSVVPAQSPGPGGAAAGRELRFTCAGCRATLTATTAWSGKRGNCPKCGAVVAVPWE